MVAATAERTGTFDDIILHNYGEAGERLGYSDDEVVAAFAPGRLEDTYATLDVNGTGYSSWRYQVGVLSPDDRSRGGCELSPGVTDEKIFGKARTMHEKHMLGNTGNVGGKGGIYITTEELAALSPLERAQLFAQHALAHNINPYTNVMATDIGTWGNDMDAVSQALTPQYGKFAGAAASGASRMYGGEPDLHAPHTGRGGSMLLDAYLREHAENPRIAEALNGGRPLTALIQGLGKAGSHHVITLPYYVQLAGAMERNGAMLANPREVLDRTQVLDLARATGLSEAGVSASGSRWLPPTAIREFWASGADIIIPAFDRNQFTEEDARNFGGIVVGAMANGAQSEKAQAVADEREFDILPDSAYNIGGTISSQGVWDKIIRQNGWTPQGFEHTWQQSVQGVADSMMTRRTLESQRLGRFVSYAEVVKLIAVERAVQRLRAAGRTHS